MQTSRNPSLRAALATAWQSHIATIQQHLPLVIADADAEDLHQLRVALRKTRALLKLFGDALPDSAHFKEEFKGFATATGPVRDLDVLLEQARQHQSELPEAERANAAPVLAALQSQRRAAQKKLGAVIRSARTRQLLDSWQLYLEQLPVRTDLVPITDIPAWTAIHLLAIKNTRRMLRESLAIDAGTSAQALHELRIRGKRLRYLLESFDLSAQKNRVGPLHKKLRKLQTVLGTQQDGAVAAERWRALIKQMRTRTDTAPSTFFLLEQWLAAAQATQRDSRVALDAALRKFARASRHL
jgi:CHAD domain-containing protein